MSIPTRCSSPRGLSPQSSHNLGVEMHIQFSNAGVEAVRNASCHSRRLGHNYVGTEHLLLSVLDITARDEVVQGIVQRFDLSIEKVDKALLDLVSPGPSTGATHRPNTPRLVKIYHDAEAQALRFGSELVRPRHLLIALLPSDRLEHEAEPSVAGVLLSSLGVNFDQAKADATQLLIQHERQSYALAMSED